MKKKLLLTILSLVFYSSVFAQSIDNQSTLSIPTIMEGERFVGYSPRNIRWGEDSKTIYFSWNPDMETLRSTYKINIKGDKAEQVTAAEQINLVNPYGDYSADRRWKVYEKDGDLFLLEIANQTKTQLTNTIEDEENPQFFDNDTKVVYQKDGNLYAWDKWTGARTQWTNFKKGKKKKEAPKKPNEQWLYDDQLANFEVLNERKTRRELEKAEREALKPKRPLEIYCEDKRVSNIRLSPDMQFVTFRLTQKAVAEGTSVPDFVTESGYVKDLNSRPKVGSPEDSYEMGVYDIQKDTFYLIETKGIDGIFDKPAFLQTYHNDTTAYESKYKKPRAVIFHGPEFSEDGKAVIELKALDNKDRWLMLLDLPTGQLTLLDRQQDDAWIGGPGVVSWNGVQGNMGWITNDKFYYQSEKTGYSHLYCVEVSSGKTKALTEGNFEILSADLSKDKQFFYITANKESPHEHHFYKMATKGGKMEKITNLKGGNEVYLSPDETQIALLHSTSNRPWELFVMENKAGAVARQLTKSTTAAFDAYPWRAPEIVYFTAADGAKVPARLYRPEGAKAGDAAVVFVHGAGYLQNVHEWWSSYYREFMFHHILMDNGYTVLDIDYRASEGYGRDWRTAIYQHMGGKDLSDQVDGAKYLVEKWQIDKNKIGIYGGSYGGFITLMAMFNAPETFKSGAALRSVTDWAHYNHPYTANILNTPVEDSLAYRRSSPIYHAAGLQGNLLILHGMVDTNVQFQDVVRLSQRLIELGKDNWELAVFPMESHGFVTPSGWTDEYKRIFKLFQTTLK